MRSRVFSGAGSLCIDAACFRPLWWMAGVFLALSAATRLMLWGCFGVEAHVPALRLPAILSLGALNDIVEALYLFVPLALYLALAPVRWHRSGAGRALLLGGIALMVAGMLFVTVAEYFFFEEFDSRFNLVAVDYLIYPTEVIGDIRSEYPVAPLLTAIAVIARLAQLAAHRSDPAGGAAAARGWADAGDRCGHRTVARRPAVVLAQPRRQ